MCTGAVVIGIVCSIIGLSLIVISIVLWFHRNKNKEDLVVLKKEEIGKYTHDV